MNQQLKTARASWSQTSDFDQNRLPSQHHNRNNSSSATHSRDYLTLWIVPVPGEATYALFRPTFLSKEELNHIENCKTVQAKRTALYSAAYMRIILAMHTGVDPHTIELSKGPYNKPYLQHPAVPLHYNVSHSKDQFVMAISRHSAVGVDVEYRDETVNIDELVHYLKIDKKLVTSGSRSMRLFYDYWVTHESLQKCAGAAAPDAFLPLDYLRPEKQQVDAFGLLQYYQRLEIIDGYSLCLAMQERNQQIYIKRIPAGALSGQKG
jgi:phosphopantetheinyl transferase